MLPCLTGNSFGHPPLGISGTGPAEGPPELKGEAGYAAVMDWVVDSEVGSTLVAQWCFVWSSRLFGCP